MPKINAVVDGAGEQTFGIWVQDFPLPPAGRTVRDRALNPQPEDRRIDKKYRDSFRDRVGGRTGAAGKSNLVVCGAQTDFCVLSTCSGAFVRGYGVTLYRMDALTADQTERGKPHQRRIVEFRQHVPGAGCGHPDGREDG